MVKINMVEEEKEMVEYNDKDLLLLKHKGTKMVCVAIITEHWIADQKRYDLTMLGVDEDRDFAQWNRVSPYNTIESLINTLENFYEVSKLEQNQYEIIVNIK